MDFNAQKDDQLSISQGEYYRILNRNIKEGWAYGYKSGNPQHKGMFPMAFVSLCNTDDGNNNNRNGKIFYNIKLIFIYINSLIIFTKFSNFILLFFLYINYIT